MIIMADNIQCRKKGCQEKEVQLHHLIPRFMGGKDIDGRKYLCKKHHGILHGKILKIIWGFVNEKEKCRQAVKKYTEWWLGK